MNPCFPGVTDGGASSAIVLEKDQTFEAYSKVDYEGLRAQLQPGQRYENSSAMGLGNEKVQSIRRNHGGPTVSTAPCMRRFYFVVAARRHNL